jgi:hypothetical protein
MQRKKESFYQKRGVFELIALSSGQYSEVAVLLFPPRLGGKFCIVLLDGLGVMAVKLLTLTLSR